MTRSDTNLSPSHSTIWTAMQLLWLLAVFMQLSRILSVQSTTGETPFHSANDRSRWCTVAALAINGSYVIDDILEIRDPVKKRRVWYTIDLVQHRGPDGMQHFYSSKPPLLPTLVTGVYMLVRNITGATLMNDTFFAARAVLIVVNLLPLAIAWWLAAHWLHRRTDLPDWSKLLLFAFITFGTFLSTFASTLNNHLPAALAVAASLWAAGRIVVHRDLRWRWFILAGLATSFAAANELPALSWVAAVAGLLLLSDLRKTVLGYLPALIPVAIGFFGTNYLAHGQFSPAYAHRGLGPQLLAIPVDSTDIPAEQIVAEVTEQLSQRGISISGQATVRSARRPGVAELWDAETEQRFGLPFTQASDGPTWQLGVHEWGDWYDYPGSYWTSERKQGVDRGEPNRLVYIFHCLIGHHGIFSLTPLWCIALLGVYQVWRTRQGWWLSQDGRLWLTAAILATSLVAVAFYLARPLEDRNYGGVTSGFRWAFWLTAPWIWLIASGLQLPQSRWFRGGVALLLAVSVFSATYPWTNPWTSPWLMQFWQYMAK